MRSLEEIHADRIAALKRHDFNAAADFCKERDILKAELDAIIDFQKEETNVDEYTIRKERLLKLIMDFAVIYHESKHKDIGNDAAEFLDDQMKSYPQI